MACGEEGLFSGSEYCFAKYGQMAIEAEYLGNIELSNDSASDCIRVRQYQIPMLHLSLISIFASNALATFFRKRRDGL